MDPRKINAQIYEEACEWFVEFRDREPEQSKRREFDRWLRASPEHLSAYLEIAGIWSAAPGLDPEHRWTHDRLVEDAGPARDNVIAFLSGVAKDSPMPAPRAKWGARRLAVALGAISFATATLGTLAWLNSNDSYDTVIGEQRSVTLPDGSTVDLNSRSRIEIHYSQRSREISLREGQALFSVAKDPSRPFIVPFARSRRGYAIRRQPQGGRHGGHGPRGPCLDHRQFGLRGRQPGTWIAWPRERFGTAERVGGSRAGGRRPGGDHRRVGRETPESQCGGRDRLAATSAGLRLRDARRGGGGVQSIQHAAAGHPGPGSPLLPHQRRIFIDRPRLLDPIPS
jgi:hypothetical protein